MLSVSVEFGRPHSKLPWQNAIYKIAEMNCKWEHMMTTYLNKVIYFKIDLI